MENTEKQKNTSLRPAICVRVTDDEYQRILDDHRLTGKSAPALLRDCYFSRKPLEPIVSNEHAKALLVALARIGNNLNQVARKVHSDIRYGLDDDLEVIKENFMALANFFNARYEPVKASKMKEKSHANR